MTDERYQLTRRKALAGLATVGAAGAAAGLGTSALYSDEETLESNVITAGTTNLKVTIGLVAATNPDLMDINFEVDEERTADGSVVTGIQVGDIKPGDCLLLRTTVDVVGNPMYVAAQALDVDDDENGENDPEPSGSGPDNNDDAIGDGSGNDAGDLDNEMLVEFGWEGTRDSGTLHDNNLDGSIRFEDGFDGSSSATATNFLDALQTGKLYRGRNGASGSPPGGHSSDNSAPPTRIGDDTSQSNVDRGKVTHFIRLCVPDSVGNNIQGDSFSWDLEWRAEQARNNADPTSASEVDGDANTATSTSTSTST